MQKEKTTALPAEIQNQITESKVDLNIAENIASYYATFFTQAQEEANKLKGLSVDSPEDVETAKRIRLDLGKICSAASARKKQDKELILIQGRYIDGLFKTVEGFARLTQKEAEKIEKHAERIEAEKLDKVESKRNETLQNLGVDPATVDARSMSSAVWDIYIKGVHDQYTARKEAEAKEEAERIQAEKRRKIFDDRTKQLLVFSAFDVKYSLSPDTTEEEFQVMLQDCEAAKKAAIEEQSKRQLHTERLTELSSKGLMKHVPKETDTDLSNLDSKEFNKLLKYCEDEDQKEVDARLKFDAEQEEKRKAAEEEAAKFKLEAEEAEKVRKAEEDRHQAEQKKKDDELKKLKDEQEKINAEAAKKLEEDKKKARELEKAPDLEKIRLSLSQCVLNDPKIKDAVMNETFEIINQKFEGFQNWAKELLDQAE
jgi:hypothetical protein